MNTPRSANLYISPQLNRWLHWIAQMRQVESPHITADAVAEEILRNAIVSNVPNIESAEVDYWSARKKLDEEAVAKLKGTTNDN